MWFGALSGLACLLACSNVVAAEDPEIKQIPLRTHSLEKPYLDSDMQSRWFDFGGDAIVRADRQIRLTGELGSRAGWVFSRVPLTATNWEIEVEFKIHGSQTLYGDGMALWITKQRAQQGQVFGSVDKFEGLGIMIDTYKNNRPGTVFPYVMAMMGDGQTRYDKENDGKSNELAGCSARGLRNPDFPTKLRLTYFTDKHLKLELSYNGPDRWEECFNIPNVKIPSVSYLGFSAETGELSDNHDLISVSTKNLYETPGPDGHAGTGNMYDLGGGSGSGKGKGKGKKKVKKPHHSKMQWFWVLLKFLMFGGLLTGVYVAFTAYRASQRKSRF